MNTVNDTPEYVTMWGKDFHNSSRIVQTKVHRNNIEAFKASGWTEVVPPEVAECPPENIPVYAEVGSKKKGEEKDREPLATAPTTLNTEPIEGEPDNETPDEADPKSIKKEQKEAAKSAPKKR